MAPGLDGLRRWTEAAGLYGLLGPRDRSRGSPSLSLRLCISRVYRFQHFCLCRDPLRSRGHEASHLMNSIQRKDSCLSFELVHKNQLRGSNEHLLINAGARIV